MRGLIVRLVREDAGMEMVEWSIVGVVFDYQHPMGAIVMFVFLRRRGGLRHIRVAGTRQTRREDAALTRGADQADFAWQEFGQLAADGEA